MKRIGTAAVVVCTGLAAIGVFGTSARAASHGERAVAPTAAEAGDALAAATSVETAKDALLTIFTNGGIAMSDGAGAPPGDALVTVPTWFLDALAAGHVAGSNLTVIDNARIYDTAFRWAGA